MHSENLKILAYYLPQFHETEENNKWWGKGYTEWENAKAARALYRGHYQPREPLGDNYYNLLDSDAIKWQTELARKHGIDGFCIYHYWFEGKQLLEKPAEILLEHKEIDFPFCFAWANHSWTRTWEGPGGDKEVLMNQTYGTVESWKKHFSYLLQFFKDFRYIKKDNKPVLLIHSVEDIIRYVDMFKVFNEEAVKEGFAGVYIIQMLWKDSKQKRNSKYINAYTSFVPSMFHGGNNQILCDVKQKANSFIKFKVPNFMKKCLYDIYDYDKVCEYLLDKEYMDNEYMGIFPGFDNTARKGRRAWIYEGSTPKKFQKYLSALIRRSIEENKDMLFITAWNEWGEGNYLEPDKRYGYAWLNAVKRARKENKI